MGNTANNNWPYPESTDLVKDGATAIENLADAIDTTLGVFVPSSPGLTLINTTSFSAVASVSLPAATFSATYQNYRVMFNVTAKSTNNFSEIRLRTSGTDNSSATYDYETLRGSSTTAVAEQTNNSTNFNFLRSVDRSPNEVFIFDVINPFATQNTVLLGTCYTTDVGTGQVIGLFGGRFENTTSFDSLSFIANTGTITGVVKCYAYSD
jgi:hypothetical protein